MVPFLQCFCGLMLPCLKTILQISSIFLHLRSVFFMFSFYHHIFFISQGNQDEVKIDRIPFTFHNLKSLEISTLFGYMEPILLLFSLLRSSPNLEKLKIEVMLNAIFWTFIIMFLKVILLLPTDFLYYFYWRRFKIGSQNVLQILAS